MNAASLGMVDTDNSDCDAMLAERFASVVTRRPLLLNAIYVLAVVLGISSLMDSAQGTMFVLGLNDGAFTERQRERDQQIRKVLDRYFPIRIGVEVLRLGKGIVLVVAAGLTFRWYPRRRQLLVGAWFYAIATDILTMVWFSVAWCATFRLNVDFTVETTERAIGAPVALDSTGAVLAFASMAALLWSLMTIGVEAAACMYCARDRSTASENPIGGTLRR